MFTVVIVTVVLVGFAGLAAILNGVYPLNRQAFPTSPISPLWWLLNFSTVFVMAIVLIVLTTLLRLSATLALTAVFALGASLSFVRARTYIRWEDSLTTPIQKILYSSNPPPSVIQRTLAAFLIIIPVFLAILILASLPLYTTGVLAKADYLSRDWDETDGVIIEKGDRAKDLTYRYQFNGVMYEHRLKSSDRYGLPDKDFKVGDLLRVHVNPDQPSESMIRPDVLWWDLIGNVLQNAFITDLVIRIGVYQILRWWVFKVPSKTVLGISVEPVATDSTNT